MSDTDASQEEMNSPSLPNMRAGIAERRLKSAYAFFASFPQLSADPASAVCPEVEDNVSGEEEEAASSAGEAIACGVGRVVAPTAQYG